MTEIDTSGEDFDWKAAWYALDADNRALLARAEKAEAERDTAWNDAIEAAAGRIDQHIQKVQPEMTRRAQRLAACKRPGFNYALQRADMDARMSCRDQVRALKKGEPT